VPWIKFDKASKPMSRDRFDKIIAIAVNPGAYEEEAIAALLKARQLAKSPSQNLIKDCKAFAA
jgi:hypothetical protein